MGDISGQNKLGKKMDQLTTYCWVEVRPTLPVACPPSAMLMFTCRVGGIDVAQGLRYSL